MPTYAGTNCQHLEKTSFRTAGPEGSFTFYNGTSLYMDKILTTEQAYMHLPCCKNSSDRVSVPVD
jgi:hypothetical protein